MVGHPWRNPRLLLLVLVIVFVGFWIYTDFHDKATYEGLVAGGRIDSIGMRLELSGGAGEEVLIRDRPRLDKIGQAFYHLRKFQPDFPKMNSIAIDMHVYKAKSANIELIKTTYSGWAVKIGSDWYRDDSLFSVLDGYLGEDSTR